jgi:rhamnose transport system permease protein
MKAFDTWEGVLLALLALLLVGFGAALPGFLGAGALADSSTNYSEKGLLALAMALLVIAGEIDLSIAATMALCSLAMGLAMRHGAGLPLMIAARSTAGW